MDKLVKRPIAILNLSDELCPELSDYFAQKEIQIFTPGSEEQEWTHILTKGVHDFSAIRENYQTIEKDIRLISLSSVNDLQNFALSNGKLILDEMWMQNSLGQFILDKFLQEYGGIALGDSYPSFQEKGSFNIANPFNTGEYLDRMVHSAFMDGVNALPIKTFFDHLVMYLAGLKASGKLGLPIEVTYGFYQDVFGVQLHFFTRDLMLEDVTCSLSSEISRKSEKFLLNLAIQSSDFFDFTLLKEVNKTVITGLWTKDERIKTENRGLLFNELTSRAAITQYPTEGVTSFQTINPDLQDFSEKIVLPASAKEDEAVTVVGGATPQEDEFAQIVKGSAPEEEAVAIIHGTKTEDDIITMVKGKVEEEEQIFRVSGSKSFDVDKFAIRVSAGIDEKAKGKEVFKIKSLKSELPDAIKTSFRDFTQRLNKSLDDISEEDLEAFKEIEVPKIIKQKTKEVDSKLAAAAKVDKAAEMKSAALSAENENLKSKIKTLMTEVKILKESKIQMAEIHQKAVQAAAEATANLQVGSQPDEALKAHLMQKMEEQKSLNEQDTKKLAQLMERETKYLKDAHENELKSKKLHIEFTQKESFFVQEIEKLNRQLKAKELIIFKSKESFTKLVEKKDEELKIVNDKLAQATKALANNPAQGQALQIRELERQIVNHEKMIEIYKNKMIQKPVAKADDDTSKEEVRKITMLNNQLKNQLDMAKKEVAKYQERSGQDTLALNSLKQDKIKLEQQLKKASQEAKKDEISVQANANLEMEIKKLSNQNEMLDGQLKDSINKQKELELKLNEALKAAPKKDTLVESADTKGKTAHLENNVRKLTQDLVESRNQLAEMKKETNKLRQEKTALQNQLDKIKKESEKTKAAAPKKPGMGGKAA